MRSGIERKRQNMNTSHERIKVVRLIPVLDFGGVESRFILQSKLIDRERFDFRVCTFWKPGAAAEKIRESGIEVEVYALPAGKVGKFLGYVKDPLAKKCNSVVGSDLYIDLWDHNLILFE